MSVLVTPYGANSRRVISASGTPCQWLRLSNSCVPANDLILRSSPLSDEVHGRTTSFVRLADNSADRCKHVLNTVVEFGIQRALVLLCSFALCDVDVVHTELKHLLRQRQAFTVRNRTVSSLSIGPRRLTGQCGTQRCPPFDGRQKLGHEALSPAQYLQGVLLPASHYTTFRLFPRVSRG